MEWSADTTEEANPAGISYPFRYDLPLHDVFAALSSSLAMRVPLSGAALFRFDDALSAPGSCRAHGMVFPPEGCTADVPDRENKHPLR